MIMKKTPVLYAILAAVCYSISAPVSKLLLDEIPPTFMAAMLYLGAGLGMILVNLFRSKQIRNKEAHISKKDLPYTIAMVVLDIAAPILLMTGMTMTNAATASLLNNFEIVATTIIALVIFKEAVDKRMWIAICFITLASILLSATNITSLSFSPGSIFVLLACICWGVENNCTRMLSLKDPLQIVVVKGLGSGFGSLLISIFIGEYSVNVKYIVIALVLGFVAYGLSIYFYIIAQRNLGAARTSAYYAFTPFIGVGLSLIIFREIPTVSFVAALIVMIIGAYLAAFEKHDHIHIHAEVEHEHRHSHDDEHHNHTHEYPVVGEHSHIHIHEVVTHTHAHTPDLHHTHAHR